MSEQRPVASLEPLAPVMNLIAQEVTLDSLTESVKVLRDQIKAIIPLYDAANYSDENLKDAKADRATLNKFSKALNDKKISFKKEFMKPFDEFESAVKEAIQEIDGASDKIDKTIKSVESREKLARQAVIDDLWKATGFTLVPLCQVQKSEWMLKATNKKAIAEGIATIQNDITSNIALLEQMVGQQDRAAVRLNFLDDLDFKRAVTYAQKLKADREETARLALMAEEQLNRPIEAPLSRPSFQQPSAPPPNPATTVPIPSKDDPVLVRTFRVTTPYSKMIKLGDFMVANGITFEKVGSS